MCSRLLPRSGPVAWTSRMRSVAAMANTPSANVSRRDVLTSRRLRRLKSPGRVGDAVVERLRRVQQAWQIRRFELRRVGHEAVVPYLVGEVGAGLDDGLEQVVVEEGPDEVGMRRARLEVVVEVLDPALHLAVVDVQVRDVLEVILDPLR